MLSYLWQTFLPPLPFMTDLFAGSSLPVMDTYIREGFASFGWYTMEFAPWVYRGIAVALLALGASALAAGVAPPRGGSRAACRSSRSCASSIAGVIGGVTAAYVSATPARRRAARAGALRVHGAARAGGGRGRGASTGSRGAGGPCRRRRARALLALLWAAQMMLLQRFYT